MPHRRTERINGQLGRALMHSKKKKEGGGSKHGRHRGGDSAHICDFIGESGNAGKMRSIIERNALDEYLATSLAAQDDFAVERGTHRLQIVSLDDNKVVQKGTTRAYDPNKVLSPGMVESMAAGTCTGMLDVVIPIPRRAVLYSGPNQCVSKTPVTAAALDSLEKSKFLEWRKSLAKMEEEGYLLSPFEKNIEFWRQLWRTIERCDIILEILDARNPLFFRSVDVEKYIGEVDPSKKVILMINKSDFLPLEARKAWAEYFEKQGISVVFFSALRELHHLGALTTTTGGDDKDPEEFPIGHGPLDYEAETGEVTDILDCKGLEEYLNKVAHSLPPPHPTIHRRRAKPRAKGRRARQRQWFESEGEATSQESTDGSDEDASEQKSEADEATEAEEAEDGSGTECEEEIGDEGGAESGDEGHDEAVFSRSGPGREIYVGTIGYPNVGKSSVINVIVGAKKVSMSRQPGKTKHIQTIKLTGSRITLCDCPGLIFPSAVATKHHLVINSVAPVDHIRGDYVSPIQLICDRISEQLLSYYNITVPSSAWVYSSALGKSVLDARTFLTAFATQRHLVSGGRGGLPDISRVVRIVLRDYTCGKLLFLEAPIDDDPSNKDAVPPTPSGSGQDEQVEAKDGFADSTSEKPNILDPFDLELLDEAEKRSPPAVGGRMTKRKERFVMKSMRKGAGVVNAPTGNLGRAMQCISAAP